MIRVRTVALAAVAVLAPALAAPSETAAQPAPAVRAAGGRVRASHRVDVIGPGERVETVIDRMRAPRPPDAGGAVRPVPPPRAGDRPQGERRDASMPPPPPPPGGTMTPVGPGPAPGSMPGPGPMGGARPPRGG